MLPIFKSLPRTKLSFLKNTKKGLVDAVFVFVKHPHFRCLRVEPITGGHRDVAVFWVQSMIRDVAQRYLLFQPDAAIQSLRARDPSSPEFVPLISTYHNLLRMWADI